MQANGWKRQVGVASWLILAAATGGWTAAADSPFSQAEAELESMRKKEVAAHDAYDSYQMAHAAAREIARSERDRAAKALAAYKTVAAAVEQAVKDGKPEAELAALRQDLADRTETLIAAGDRMMIDAQISNGASQEVLDREIDMRQAMQISRDAEHALLAAKTQAAEAAGGADAQAARLAVQQLALLRAIESQQWPNLRRLWSSEFAEQARESARIAQSLAEVEPNAERKAKLEAFAQQQSDLQAANDKIASDCAQQMEDLLPGLYPLRAAAYGGLTLLSPDQFDHAKARHLLVRAGFGGTPAEVAKLQQLGLYKAVDQLVEYYRQPGAPINFDPVPPQRLDPLNDRMTVRTMNSRVVAAQRAVERGQVAGLRQAWLRRMVETPRPLQEKLALFWHGLFASQESVVENSYTMFRQIQFFREHAGGNYAALLYGIVHDPAMIRYLDNNQNVKGKPNENLGREILELFSMGVDQGYTEQDIIEAARALTGYNYDHVTGGYRFNYDQHDTGDKTIFGQTGPWTGDDLVRLILDRPETGRFVARRLWEYFAGPDPDEETVEALATVLRTNQYDLEPVLKNMFMSEKFYSAPVVGNQIKSPVELVVGLLRDVGVKQLTSYGGLDGAIQQMGLQLLEPPDVKGWRYGRSWINSQRLFVRYNSVANLVKAATPTSKQKGFDLVALVQEGKCGCAAEAVDYLAKACLLRPLADEKRQELTAFLGELPPAAEWKDKRDELNGRLQAMLVLMLSMPEYQLM